MRSGHTTTTAYDVAGNAVAAVSARGFATTTAYDALDRAVAVTDPLGHTATTAYDADGDAVATVDALGNVTTAAYDALDRAVAVTRPNGGVTTTVYDAAGNAVAAIDPLGHATTTVYDALNRAYVTVDALGGRTTSLFDAAGDRTTLVDPDGNRTTWAYDALSRVTTETDPLGNAATYAYDALGRQVSTTDRLGRRIDDAFDALGRKLTESWYAAGGAFAQALTWTYDADGDRLTAQAPAGSYTLTYDALDRVATAQEPFGLSLTFAYDADGNRVGVTDSKGGVQTSVYDAADRLTSRLQTGNGATLRFDESYTARNELAAEVRYSDLAGTTQVGETDRTYDADGNAATVTQKNGAGATFDITTYAYDLADRLTVQTDNGSARTFTYDATSQLTADSGSTFAYDANGNRTNVGYATGTGNQTTSDGTWTYTYDAAGNRTKKSLGASAETWTYQYDQWNHLTRVEKRATDGGTLELRIDYAYDAFGNLLTRKQYDGSLTLVSSDEYGLDGWKTNPDGSVGLSNWDAWADLDGSSALVNRRVYGDRTDEVAARASATGTVAWYGTDRQGSVRFLTDAAGAVQTTISYDGFGNIATETGGAFADRYGYTGRELDAADGLLQLRDRELALDLGRFLTRDPMGFGAGDANLTRYTANSFANASDPSGDWVLSDRSNAAQLLGETRTWLASLSPAPGIFTEVKSLNDDGAFLLPIPGQKENIERLKKTLPDGVDRWILDRLDNPDEHIFIVPGGAAFGSISGSQEDAIKDAIKNYKKSLLKEHGRLSRAYPEFFPPTPPSVAPPGYKPPGARSDEEVLARQIGAATVQELVQKRLIALTAAVEARVKALAGAAAAEGDSQALEARIRELENEKLAGGDPDACPRGVPRPAATRRPVDRVAVGREDLLPGRRARQVGSGNRRIRPSDAVQPRRPPAVGRVYVGRARDAWGGVHQGVRAASPEKSAVFGWRPHLDHAALGAGSEQRRGRPLQARRRRGPGSCTPN